MNVNLTLFGELITFAILVFVTMKYVWPPITKAMEDRQKKIADGLEAARRGEKSLILAQQNITQQLRDAKLQAGEIIEQAKLKTAQILEEAKVNADKEGKKILALAQADVGHALEQARAKLQDETANLAIAIAEKILQQSISKEIDQQLLDKFMQELAKDAR